MSHRRPIVAARLAWVITAAGCSPFAGIAFAQDEMAPAAPSTPAEKQPVETTPAQSPAAPLSGPTVKPAGKAVKTLIERDFSGKIKRLEVSPPEAALALLDLDEATRAKANALLLERSRTLDGIVRDNLKLIVRLAGARDAASTEKGKAEYLELIQELSEKALPLRERGTLQAQLQAILPEAARNQLTKLSQDYWNALLEEKQAAAKQAAASQDGAAGGGMRGKETREFMRGEFMAIVGQEIKRSYERVVGQQTKDFDELLKSLNLTDAQESKIRKLVGDSFVANYGKVSPAERAKVFTQVYRELDEQQRATLMERVRGSGRTRGE